ncbi:MAG: cytochrome c maturation protein CcmE [Archaeoglobaceae archaeon]|nr:cytochrome c maturation protein CcmE [Archaeoglobaceae archaeon]
MQKLPMILLFAFAGFAVFTLYHSVSSSLTPSDLLALGDVRDVVVSGKIENLVYDNGSVHFYITDGKAKIKAIYSGKITGEEIIARGDWISGNFYVKEALSKCHTQYSGG